MDPLLYGHNDEQHVVAVHQLNDSEVRLYQREGKNISHKDVKLFPFFFLSHPSPLEGFGRHYWLKELGGKNYFRYIVAFSRWSDMWDALRTIITSYNRTASKRAQSYTDLDILLLKPDPIQQFLLQSGVTHFKGMEFTDLLRMQIDIITGQSGEPRTQRRSGTEVITHITLSDNDGWMQTFDATKDSEAAVLKSVVTTIRVRDPDVLEGHQLFGEQLPMLLRRAHSCGIELAIGRDGTPVRSFVLGEGEAGTEGGLFEIAGRHLIDTMQLAQSYDATRRTLEGNAAVAIAQQLGFRLPDTQGGPTRKARLLQGPLNVAATRFIADQLLPSSFYLTQMCPMSFGSVARTGSAVKIELLMLREYLRQKHSLPRPQPGTQTTGGYTDIFLTGVVGPVIQADVESLYPSIILSQSIAPSTDELRVFPKLLSSLLHLRLQAKKAMQEATEPSERLRADALQSSLKILINSFYGYLGYNRALFNDYAQADRVTTTGQQLLREIIQHVVLHNASPVEVDTDGIFFVPPDNIVGEENERMFVERISKSLPPGINLLLAGRYKKMLSYKKKNYALLSFDGSLTMKGSSLISRSLEPFCRQFIRECIICLLNENIAALHEAYVRYARRIINHQWHVIEFARTETLRDSLEQYEAELTAGTRNPSAAYEVAKRASRYVKRGDRISYYVTGSQAGVRIADNSRLAEEWDPNFPDENTAYYLNRLEECSRKFEIFFSPEDFRRIFSLDDLFGFDPHLVKILTKQVGSEEKMEAEEQGEFGIWLDEG